MEMKGYSDLRLDTKRADIFHYLIELCEMAIEEGLLPHTNAGIMTEEEMAALAPYNASMGLMLETTADVPAHEGSPGKAPAVRIRHIRAAGELKIPFTTGILLGIGEGMNDRLQSLEAIAAMHHRFSHIQEVIIQPFDPKPGTQMMSAAPPSLEEVRRTVCAARTILPPDIAIQVPPNLVDPATLIKAGANDLGGLSPITPDWINPNRPWPTLESLQRMLGIRLRERLPVYPSFVKRRMYGIKTAAVVKALSDSDGYRAKGPDNRK
jgi:FO synthase subunit 1